MARDTRGPSFPAGGGASVDYAQLIASCSVDNVLAALAAVAEAPEASLRALEATHAAVIGRSSHEGHQPARSAYRPLVEAALEFGEAGFIGGEHAAPADRATAAAAGLLRAAVASRDVEALGIGLQWAFRADAGAQVPLDIASLAVQWLSAFEASAAAHCLAWVAMHACASPADCRWVPTAAPLRKWICFSCNNLNDSSWRSCSECTDHMAGDIIGGHAARAVARYAGGRRGAARNQTHRVVTMFVSQKYAYAVWNHR